MTKLFYIEGCRRDWNVIIGNDFKMKYKIRYSNEFKVSNSGGGGANQVKNYILES